MKKCFVQAALSALVMFWVGSALAQDVPGLINYQGVLYDDSGSPAPNGNYEIAFRVWDTPTGGAAPVWGQVYQMTIGTGGRFNVLLGSGGTTVTNPSPAQTDVLQAFNGASRFLGLTVLKKLGVTVPSPTEILPRQQLVSAPYAIHAGSAGFATVAALATNAISAASAGYAASASDATNAGYAASASYATNAGTAANADNANLLDSLDSTAFVRTNKFPGATANPPQLLSWNGTSGAYAPVYVSNGNIGVGATNAQNALYVAASSTGAHANLNAGVHLGGDINGNTHMEIVSTSNKTPYIDFSNNTNKDNDARISLNSATNLVIEGKVSMFGAVAYLGDVRLSSWPYTITQQQDGFYFISVSGGQIMITIGGAHIFWHTAVPPGGLLGTIVVPVAAGKSLKLETGAANPPSCHVSWQPVGR